MPPLGVAVRFTVLVSHTGLLPPALTFGNGLTVIVRVVLLWLTQPEDVFVQMAE